jgi:hypothetical protein
VVLEKEKKLFTVMLKDPRIKCTYIIPSCGLFLTCRGKNSIVIGSIQGMI